MAITDKDILITPNRGQTAEPKIEFKGASATLGPQTISLNVYPTNNGTVSFEGSAGQLFSITNDLSGTIYSVNDVSGIPSIEVLDSGLVKLAQYSGNVLIGTGTDNGSRLQVNGVTTVSGNNYTQYGPNSTWGAYLRIGGNGTSVGANIAGIATTDGNLHIDAGTAKATYLNFYSGTGGVAFGSGSGAPVAWMGPDGDLWKGTTDNSGVQYVQNTGTWNISVTGNSGQVGGLTPNQFFNSMGTGHGAYTNFNDPPGFGSYYFGGGSGASNPTGSSGAQWYGFTLGLGNQYPVTDYASQIYWPRRSSDASTYIYIRDREGGSWTSWTKIMSGYSDSAGSTVAANNYQVNSIGVGIAGSGTQGAISLNQGGVRSWNIVPTGGNLDISSGDGLGQVRFSPSAHYSKLLYISNTAYGIDGTNGYFDTVNSGDNADALELVYHRGSAVKIGSGTYGSKPLYAVGLYDNGNQVLHAGNYTSYSPSLTGSGASGTWGISVTGSSGSVSGLTLTSSANGINPDSVTQNQIGYNTSVQLFGQTDGGLYSSVHSSSWIHQIYGDFRTGQLAVRGKNNGTWQAWRTVLDSSNYTSYAATSGHNHNNTNITARTLTFTGEGTDSGNGSVPTNYGIYQQGGAWSWPYPDLCIGFHTGIKIGAHYSYNGTRFYNNSDWATEIFSVGDGDNNVRVQSDIRAPILYDLNDTNYYLNPNSTSSLYKVNIHNNIEFTNYGRGMIGTYTSTRYQAVFAMGSSYVLPDDGSTTGTLYGLAWSHPNAGGVASNLNTHGLLAMENGTWLASVSGSIRCRDDMRAPIYYDNNNTAYYVDPNSTSNLLGLTVTNTISGNITGSSGSVSGLTLTQSSNGINPDSVTQNQIGYNNNVQLVQLFGHSDGGLYSSAYDSAWIHQIYGDFRTGQIAIRGKNSGTWTNWRTVIDSGNIGNYVQSTNSITTTASSKTLVAGEYCTVTAAGQTITLPLGPAVGTTVKIGVGNFTNTIIARNSQNIMQLSENMTIDAPNSTITLTYINGTIGWKIG